MKKIILFLLTWFLFNCSPGNIKIGESYELGEVPKELLDIESKVDPFQKNLTIEMSNLPGHDDLIFDPILNIAYASGMDGWIWKINFKTNLAEQWYKPPVNPAGMSFADKKNDKILFCASKLGGESYDDSARVGLYEVEISSKNLKPLVLDLPKTDKIQVNKVYTAQDRKAIPIETLNEINSRKFSLCNDLAVSKDGNRIYLSEPFEREDAGMGSGAVPEAIGLYPHGKLWLYDRTKDTIELILDGFTFIDGLLIEEDGNGKETALIFSETTKFRILRAFLVGKRAGEYQTLHENLPGLADGLERDVLGRIWVGIIKPRSKLINFVHKNPWIKSFLLNIPSKLLPIAKKTGVIVLNQTGEKPLYFVMHDGSKINDISVAVPNGNRVYFPVFDKKSKGLYSLSLSELKLGEDNEK